MAGHVLELQGLRVTLDGAPLVDGVDLTIARGERVGLIGESGSGKSLTALAVMGLLDQDLRAEGSVRLDGAELLGMPERELAPLRGSRVSMVFQEPLTALDPLMRAGDQVAEVVRLHRPCSREAARARALELFTRVGLPEPAAQLGAYPHQLSGGQRQRVLIAMALANEPALVIADEPTTALDTTMQAQILELLARLVREQDAALLFITHDLAVVAQLCERVVVLQDGAVVERGATTAVFARPEHPHTQALLAGTRALAAAAPPAPLAPEAPPLLEARGLVRVYRRPRGLLRGSGPTVRALDGIDLVVRRGERLGIVGESGSGKSTLARLLVALDRPTEGEVLLGGVRIDGRPERELRDLRRRAQIVLQDPRASLDPRLRVRDILLEPLRALAIAGDHGARMRELLELVGLPASYAERRPHQLSGGQRQRVAIARALAPGPELVIADEPVSALDVSIRAQVLDLLRGIAGQLGLTLVFVSHDLAVVRHLCDRVAVMRAGRIVEHGPVAEVLGAPRDAYTRALLAAVPPAP